jgi:hypothetical protein
MPEAPSDFGRSLTPAYKFTGWEEGAGFCPPLLPSPVAIRAKLLGAFYLLVTVKLVELPFVKETL